VGRCLETVQAFCECRSVWFWLLLELWDVLLAWMVLGVGNDFIVVVIHVLSDCICEFSMTLFVE
jgi:hypothetical protein